MQIKVRFADFQTITRSQKLQASTNSTELLWQCAAKLLSTRLPHRHLPVRLLGMGVSGIDRSQLSQGTLFDDGQEQYAQLDAIADSIQDRFGTNALRRGSSLPGNAKHRPSTPKPGR